MKIKSVKKAGKQFLVILALVPGLILIIFPMYVTIVTAFKTPQELGYNFFLYHPRYIWEIFLRY